MVAHTSKGLQRSYSYPEVTHGSSGLLQAAVLTATLWSTRLVGSCHHVERHTIFG